MKILHWPPFYAPTVGGIENQLLTVVPLLRDRGYQNTVLASIGPDCTDPLRSHRGIDIHRLPFREAVQGQSPLQIMQVRRQLATLKAEVRPDLIHIHFSGPESWFHLQTLAAWPCPTVVTIHNSIENHGPIASNDQSVVGALIRGAAWTIAVSKYSLTELHTALPEMADRSSVVYNAVEIPAVSVERPHPLRLGLIGRVTPQKNPLDAIEAMALLHATHPQAELLVVGDGVLMPALKQRVVELGLENVVHCVGSVDPDKVGDYIASCHAILMPSKNEGLPLVSMEAAFAGVPLVATPVDGLTDIVLPEITGLSVPVGNVVALAAAARRLLDDGQLRNELGKAFRSHVTAIGSVEKTVDGLDAIYQRAIAEFAE